MTTIKDIKHEFMAFRNGVVADTLRKAGLPFGVIFGLQLPQIRQIAAKVISDVNDAEELKKLSLELIADSNVRESRILAFAIMPSDSISKDEAVDLCRSVMSREEADLLPFLLLRKTPYIPEILREWNIDIPEKDYLESALRRFV